MVDISQILGQHPVATLRIETDGPPNFDSARVIISGDPAGFRMLAAILNAMADAVSTAAHPASRNGWQLGLSPGDVRQLKMAHGILSLDCEPSR
jgi:hypothetical protein